MGYDLPKTERAVQLVGKDELRFNAAKPVDIVVEMERVKGMQG